MSNPFSTQAMAEGYAKARPAVHPLVTARIMAYFEGKRFRRALDVGCGAGLSTGPLAELADCRVGLEPVEAMLKFACGVAPGAQFVVGRAESMPIATASVDLIAAAGSLNYADLDAFFPEARRVFREGGSLVVYDFSQGRRFRTSGELDGWYADFIARYPSPPREARPLDPEILASVARGFRVAHGERFELAVPMECAAYREYMLTEANVAFALRNGTPAAEIRGWCEQTLPAVFQGRAREVMFPGYIAYLKPEAVH